MVFHGSLSDNKSSQLSRTLLGILVNLNNAVVWMGFTCPLISKSSSSCTNPLVTVPRAPITIAITITFMLHSFFSSFQGLSFHFLSVLLCGQLEWQSQLFNRFSLFFFLLTITWSDDDDDYYTTTTTTPCEFFTPALNGV